ncbi:hypothetical protein G9464_17900 [Halostella sp. JP-L12]|uniref:hypothetical protein n=1 Tax=Halostella TaxID=1843185 RepID=UPI000EF7F3B9|nr:MULTISPECIES: hypothetical protein [Halostella]NHN49448.1 hypothetical protein [Halostella sp. JP-L12]
MPTKEVSINLGQTDVSDLELSRRDDGQTIDFSVEGTVRNVDEETVENVMLSQQVDPVSITLAIDVPEDEQ